MKRPIAACCLATLAALATASLATANPPGQPLSSVSFDDTTSCGFLVHRQGVKASANFPNAKAGALQLTLTNPANGKTVKISTSGNFAATQNPDGTTTITAQGSVLWLFDANKTFHSQGIYLLRGYQVATFASSGPEPLLNLRYQGGDSRNYCDELA